MIRKLWDGELTSHRGKHFTVENARIYSLPDKPPPLLVAVAGESRSSSPGASVTAWSGSRRRPRR